MILTHFGVVDKRNEAHLQGNYVAEIKTFIGTVGMVSLLDMNELESSDKADRALCTTGSTIWITPRLSPRLCRGE